MRRNDAVFAPPPPLLMAVPQNTLPQPELATTSGGGPTTFSPSVDGALSPSIIITVLVVATAIIVSASIFLLLRCVSVYCRRRRRSSSVEIDAFASDSFPRYHSHGSTSRVAPENSSIIDSLPLFTFASITGSNAAKSGGDCAVCLSKFEPQDQLRLLPVCCHAFHADCIDAWISNNETCPLCRSSILLSESEVMSKILSTTAPNSAIRSGSGSFRVEIGSISRRHLPSDAGSDNHGRSFSIGSFDYIVDDAMSEVAVASTRRRLELAAGGDKSGITDESEIHVVAPPGETVAAEVAAGGERSRNSWLKDYVERVAWTPSFSLSSSFRSSGRFFAGSSRRTDASRVLESDLEASRLGDEISEMFRWLSGV